MAEAIAGALRKGQRPLVVGIMGSGHVEYGDGVAHQLAALKVNNDVVTALPWNSGTDCPPAVPRIANLIFGLAPSAATRTPPPRLGVVVSKAETGVKIDEVVTQSVAETTSLQAGDVIETAAGVSVRRPADLIAIVQRQAPGTWLPLTVRRDEARLEMVARFPAER
jgi:S1-C subfamily serine protease